MNKTNDTPIHERKILTTGAIAQLCSVAPRTAAAWFDDGKLQGYRIPSSRSDGKFRERRIPRESLVKFLKENGMPTIEQFAGV